MFDSSRSADVTFLLLLNGSRALNIRWIRLYESTASIPDDLERKKYSSTIVGLKEMNEIIVDLKVDEILEDARRNDANVLNEVSFLVDLIESIDLSFENESTNESTDLAESIESTFSCSTFSINRFSSSTRRSRIVIFSYSSSSLSSSMT